MTRDRAHTLFGQTMGYVAVTTGFFALGAYVGRHLSAGWAIVWFIVAFACLVTVLTLAAFDLPVSLPLAAVLYGALLLGLSVPSAPGAVGTFELTPG